MIRTPESLFEPSRWLTCYSALILAAFAVYCAQAYYCYALIGSTGYFVHQWNLTVGDLIPTAWVWSLLVRRGHNILEKLT